jgi:lipopolysaccharide exporter
MNDSPFVRLPQSCARRALVEPVIRHAGWFGFFLVLAPIIGPRGYGLFVMGLSGIAIVEALLAETITGALARIEPLDDRHVSTALIGAISAGGFISLTLYAAGGALGAMLDEATFSDIFQSLSLLPVLGGLTAVPIALLRRRGKHAPFIAATTGGVAAGGLVAVALAWAGAGPWSLVAQIVVQRFVECAVLWGTAEQRIGLVWSRAHFKALLGILDLRTLAAVWPVAARHAPCLLIGLVLGPAATGLYVLAARFPEALSDILLAAPKPLRRALLAIWADDIGSCVRRVALPAILASTLLAVAEPPLVDMRWWGAVLPAQILLLGLIPAAVIAVREAAAGSRNEACWQAVQTLGGIAVLGLVAPYGLAAIATASLAYGTIAVLVGLAPLRRELGPYWIRAVIAAMRPVGAAAAAGLVLYVLAGPVSLALAPLPALCLLCALGRLLYLLVDGEPPGAPGLGPAIRRWFSPPIGASVAAVTADTSGAQRRDQRLNI